MLKCSFPALLPDWLAWNEFESSGKTFSVVIQLMQHIRPVARGGVVGVPTPPSGINVYLIQVKPFDYF